ncbi:MAG: hypothetical protein JWP12_2894 [Bacteroidetes bacterium]|nr:hypothetical protein [Bacteroidota bacterium]
MPFSENDIISSTSNILDHFTEGVIALNKEHQLIFTSNYFIDLIGFSKAELMSRSLEELFPEKKNELQKIIEAAEHAESIVFHTELTRKDGSCFTARVRLLKNEDAHTDARFLLYIKDNTPYQRIRKDILRKTLTVEALSKSRKIRDGKLDDAVHEILEMASRAVDTQRVNAWVFNEDHSEIHCIGNFDSVQNKFLSQANLPRIAMPNYFKLFESEKIIITSDVYNDHKTDELLEFYLEPFHIRSLMDIPIRIEGEMIGVVCFEHTETPREWNLQEQKFGLVIAQIISLAIETNEKLKARTELEQALAEQKVLLQEVHHRVKNNLTIISSLMNLQSEKAKDEYHRSLFQEGRNRLDSIAVVHQLLYQSKSYSDINFKFYIEEILNNLFKSFDDPEKEIKIVKAINDISLDVSTAIPLALIVNELVTNAYKHAFKNQKSGVIELSLIENNKTVFLKIRDNGPGFDPAAIVKSSVGLDILDALIEQIDAKMNYSNKNGSNYEISFVKK